MKLIQRLLLGIIRKPQKTILLVLIVFIMSNLISGSFILYNISQSIKTNLLSKMSPAVIFESDLSRYNLDYAGRYELYFHMENHIQALNEILELSEVKYGDYGIEYNVNGLGRDFYFFDGFGTLDTTGYDTLIREHIYSFTGVDKENFYYLNNGLLSITAGRNITQEEIDNGSPVIIIPKNSKYYINEKEYFRINVGDKILIHSPIYDASLPDIIYYDKASDDEIKKYNEAYSASVIYEEIIELKVVGLYEDPNWNKKADQGKFELSIGDYTVIAPMKLVNELYQNKFNKINEYEAQNIGLASNYLIRYDRYNYFELTDSLVIPQFTKKANEILKSYGLDNHYLKVSNEVYLKVAGPLEAVNSVSKTILIAAIVISLIVLSCVSLIFLKDRKKEIGILLSLGESKKRIVKQIMCEMFLIGMIGIGGSLLTSKNFSNIINENIIGNYQGESLSEQDKVFLPENVDQRYIMNQYDVGLKNSDTVSVVGISIIILAISMGGSLVYIMKMKSKDILL